MKICQLSRNEKVVVVGMKQVGKKGAELATKLKMPYSRKMCPQ
jgi:hypothetical protein